MATPSAYNTTNTMLRALLLSQRFFSSKEAVRARSSVADVKRLLDTAAELVRISVEDGGSTLQDALGLITNDGDTQTHGLTMQRPVGTSPKAGVRRLTKRHGESTATWTPPRAPKKTSKGRAGKTTLKKQSTKGEPAEAAEKISPELVQGGTPQEEDAGQCRPAYRLGRIRFEEDSEQVRAMSPEHEEQHVDSGGLGEGDAQQHLIPIEDDHTQTQGLLDHSDSECSDTEMHAA